MEIDSLGFCVLNTQNMDFLSFVLLGALPQVFFPQKIDVLYFINREPLFLCLKHIQAQLLGSKVAFRVHETLVWHTPADPPDPADPPEVV